MKINSDRLSKIFIKLCETDSPSKQEGAISVLLKKIFAELGCDEIYEDASSAITGSECGNLIITFDGDKKKEPVFFNCHMDTVEPGSQVRVKFKNGLFQSKAETILGSDDKSGITCLIEAITLIKEQNLSHCPFELVFTTCEEIGLLGVKALDPKRIKAKMGYALDSTGIGRVVLGAPASNRLNITIKGIAAHAGLHPEWGVNAINLAAQALVDIPSGRIDEETSVNFGKISGGTASNIVADNVLLVGEVRSHSKEKLERITKNIQACFNNTIDNWNDPTGVAKGMPKVICEVIPDFPIMDLKKDDPVSRRVNDAAKSIDLDLNFEIAGGGSDANILNGYGLQTAIIATGMSHVHSTEEYIKLDDMLTLTRLLIAILCK